MDTKLIIFDFDGTLGNTRGIVVTTMQKTLQEFLLRQAAEAERGQPMRSDEKCAATIGLPLAGCFRQLIPEATDEVIQQCVDIYHRLFDINKDCIKPQTFPHVKETLAELYRQGIRMTVTTSRAGCRTCAVTYGNATREELEEAGSDYIINDITELLRI